MAKKQDVIIGIVIAGVVLVFIVLFVLALIGLGSSGDMDVSGSGQKVAIVDIEGVIFESKEIVRQLKKYQKDRTVKAVVVRINSPGGGIAASQEIYEHIRRVRDDGKPVVASMGSVAASGGYYVALGADSIMANPGTTTGSIGVIAEFPNFSKLMEKIGVDFTVIKSGKFKDSGSPYRDPTPEERVYFQEWINDGFKQFVDVVAEERQMDRQQVLKIADGRVFTGLQAKAIGLIDSLGTYDDAIMLAARMGGIEGEPRLKKEAKPKYTIFDLLSSDIRQVFMNIMAFWPQAHYIATW
ncbi:signal peptide peptidase SppA [candidate division KSB1 bacterium]|nr:signal peptide peptidase SppA [candidate division KSB1 bacterium]